MDDSAFSDDFRRFLQSSVPSVDAAELLLALAAQPERWWQPAELVANVRPPTTVSGAQAARHFEQFQASRLAVMGPDRRLQYRPADERLAGHVRMLAQAYKERPGRDLCAARGVMSLNCIPSALLVNSVPLFFDLVVFPTEIDLRPIWEAE